MRGVTRGALTAFSLSGLAAASLAVLPATAEATPPDGVTGKILYQRTVGDTDYVLREITILPGGTTGWHFHDGTLYAFVKAGKLDHFGSNCKSDGKYRTGDTFVEPSNQVHIGKNLGKTPIVLEVLYVNPHGAPLSEDAANPGCSFQ
ncbi:cupin domain-containing protein [Kribbella sandramycini]|uniref:Cupin domain-containing protein n=1 Tax=Kribbella sandramycini TaxID=60450 RepID=A0A7Y4NZN2_9ACTN|nr:cupin domain-containing protein [Kribbella sandramycini]MBB6570017.1 quercetin dioxygenase-like cupin family protein [Kribbella sandramycini]NOL40159.1 cupin domain-containing protein [Kribbella sandramycini]